METNKNVCIDRIRECIEMINWNLDGGQHDEIKLYYIRLWSEDIIKTIRTHGELSIKEGASNVNQ
jgi:hypothetical protein